MITDLAPHGLLEETNQLQISKGSFHFVATVGMWIEVANDVTGNGEEIANVLRTCETVRLCIRRATLVSNSNAQ